MSIYHVKGTVLGKGYPPATSASTVPALNNVPLLLQWNNTCAVLCNYK